MTKFSGDVNAFTALRLPFCSTSNSRGGSPDKPSLGRHHSPYRQLLSAESYVLSSSFRLTKRPRPPLARAGRSLSRRWFPTFATGYTHGGSCCCCLRPCHPFFGSKEKREKQAAFSCRIDLDCIDKSSIRHSKSNGSGAHKRGYNLVADCESGDGNGYASLAENLSSGNGHASSVGGNANGLVRTSHDDISKGFSKSENSLQHDEFNAKGEDGSDKAANEEDNVSLEHLKEILQSAVSDLERARMKSSKVEEDARAVAEKSLSLHDIASEAESKAEKVMVTVDKVLEECCQAQESVSKARLLLAEAEENVIQSEKALAEARQNLRMRRKASDTGEKDEVIEDSPTPNGAVSVLDGINESVKAVEITEKIENSNLLCNKEEEILNAAQEEMEAMKVSLTEHEKELSRIQSLKSELEKETVKAKAAAKLASDLSIAADAEVAQVMSLAEKAVALELDAAQKVCIAEMALQKAEKIASEVTQSQSNHLSVQVDQGGFTKELSDTGRVTGFPILEASLGGLDTASTREKMDIEENHDVLGCEQKLVVAMPVESSRNSDDAVKILDGGILQEAEEQKPKMGAQQKKESTKEHALSSISKSSTKRSSRFLPASFFSFNDEEEEFTLTSVVRGVKEHFLKVAVGVLLLCGGFYLRNRMSNPWQFAEQTDLVISFEEVTTSAKPVVRELQKLPRKLHRALERISHQEVNGEDASLFDVLWLLLASVIFVPIFQRLPGGSPVLGYLAAGVLIGPHSLSIIRHVHGTRAIAEFGVVFLLFNIGLELSVERLSSMKKYVFGLGTSQVFVTALAVGLVCHHLFGFSGPAALVVGNGLALSSTAVVLQVLQERGENTSRHGRATFSVLLFQDLAVVVLLILLPLISPSSSKGGVGFQAIAEALGVAAVKGVLAIAAIIAGGRLLLRPIYKRMAENHNAEIFAANTLFVVLGTSVLTARAGLSMALGAFLAGLLLAETEFALQVESDIAPYRGLLLGLFFMTVGMAIDPKLFVSKFTIIIGALSLLIIGKIALVVSVGRLFGLSSVAAVRTGLLLAPGGEFAFVAFGEAVNQKIMSSSMSSLLFLVVGLSMALTPWLGALGQILSSQFEQHDVRSLLPAETETDDLQGHMILCGFGRVGQIIAQLLSDRLIPFVALDVRSERVTAGRALDLPVYFGDAGSKEVLHKVGAERASAAVIALDTPGANFRAVWALKKHFPNVKTFVRAHDVEHGINLEKAGATAVVPETLEPSLQLAAAVLAQAKLPATEIAATIDEFRFKHMSELTELCEISGSCLGYGFSRTRAKPSIMEKMDDGVAGEPWQEALAVP